MSSREISPPRAARRSSPAIFRRDDFTKHKSATQRAGAVILWLTSVAGALLWGGGGWVAWSSWSPNLLLALLAFVLQMTVSWSQIVSSDRPFSVQYLVSLAVSVITTLAGYLPLLTLWMSQSFGVQLWSSLWWVVAVVTSALAIAADVVPERTLFEE